MMFLKVAFLLVVGVALDSVHADEPERIVGGSDATPGEFPYQISLQRFGAHFCGGALITKQHVLTAAHCIEGIVSEPYDDFSVVTGIHDLRVGGQTHKIKSVKTHANYRGGSRNSWLNDIALITLEAPIEENDNQRPIPFALSDPSVGATAVVSGWGQLGALEPGSDILQKTATSVTTNQQCQQAFSRNTIYSSQICAFNRRGVGTCMGDSGGPLVQGGRLIGVVSWSYPCATGTPDVYTRVSKYADFINDAIAEN